MFKASVNVPQLSSTCTSLYFPNVAGAGMFRFEDGSLLFVNLTGGGDCIDPVRMMATCTLTFKISGGTGRFKNASGALTLTETALPVMADSQGNPIFFSEAGEFTGTISGLALEDASRETRQ